ncbi:hypothetical protein DUNSADRAFT_16863 [Dunaliella salina]|uniref:NAD-dependent epimerase/dehydratase domain-containing protein n=1 Tax=Dunaliella salina TaxID=3046 RepID=A0ABQ7G2P7_DUNSA|nr:hypothetical protein DUNSADRAFT_16863 [Dunaliella salina]|eukprot:KAF5828877.1 hypothetical protein DUNSADRAFT_16863 [Dunaliella salina]
MPRAHEAHAFGGSTQAVGGGYYGTGQYTAQQGIKILVTGACGQVGTELLPYLRERVGVDNIIDAGPFEFLDVRDKDNLSRIIIEHGCNRVIHLATLLSVVGEKNPALTLKINNNGIQNILELAAQQKLQVMSPSTIAVFGPNAPKENTPNDAAMNPSTIYGISKVHTELLGSYYRERFNVDFRSLRLPGIIGKAKAGGGTTDYAVDIFQAAVLSGKYTCFLPADLDLPMLYMPDCLDAFWNLIQAPRKHLTRCVYNVQGMSFSPHSLSSAIQKHLPHFQLVCKPDFREAIARSWPRSVDDSFARADWGWKPKYDLQRMTQDMLKASKAFSGQ